MKSIERLSEYRIMWIIVLFDLPTETSEEKKIHSLFRKSLLRDGFGRMQLSIYIRHCASVENAEVHTKRVESFMPVKGMVSIMMITDKQFGMIKTFIGRKSKSQHMAPPQLEMF
jgi:CRISPR-associated protein Cas2